MSILMLVLIIIRKRGKPNSLTRDDFIQKFQTICASSDTLNNSNLPAFLYRCDTTFDLAEVIM